MFHDSILWQKLKSLFFPERFQGWGRTASYFEGWYFKLLTADTTKALAIIPGIAMDEKKNKIAFIQVLDGIKNTSLFHRFPFGSFSSSFDDFRISIANNHFSHNGLELNEIPNLKGKIDFSKTIKWKSHWYGPGIMGPFTFLPFMECNHGIVSLDHELKGSLTCYKDTIDFTNGRGYTEKDWGKSFPLAYVWMQSNHFKVPGISIKVSIAKIPWFRFSFVGFIAGIWINDRLISFTSYNNSELKYLKISLNVVELALENKNYRLEASVDRKPGSSLFSPIRGLMEGKIEESLTSTIKVHLKDKKNDKIVLLDSGKNAGLEVAGKIEEIIR